MSQLKKCLSQSFYQVLSSVKGARCRLVGVWQDCWLSRFLCDTHFHLQSHSHAARTFLMPKQQQMNRWMHNNYEKKDQVRCTKGKLLCSQSRQCRTSSSSEDEENEDKPFWLVLVLTLTSLYCQLLVESIVAELFRTGPLWWQGCHDAGSLAFFFSSKVAYGAACAGDSLSACLSWSRQATHWFCLWMYVSWLCGWAVWCGLMQLCACYLTFYSSLSDQGWSKFWLNPWCCPWL